MSLRRRDFLKIVGGLSFGLPLYNCAFDIISDSASGNAWNPGIEGWVPTVCQACQGGCGLLVRKIDDRAVKVEGNPFHPLNRGRVCSKGQAGLQLLYNPNRIKTPLKKVGNRDSGAWQPVGWNEALDIVAEKLKSLRESEKSHTVALLENFNKNTSNDLVARFLNIYGSPNHVQHDDWSSVKDAYYTTQGIHNVMAVDFEKTNYVLSFGADFLTNWPTSMENQRVYGMKRANRDIKIIQIEPRFSLCASKTDKWIPIHPGTEGLLAMGIASVILKEELHNRKYIERFTTHFEDWLDDDAERRVGFKNSLLREIRLDHVSDITGVPLKTIIEIAKEFSTLRPAVAVADYNFSYHPNGLSALLAIHSLNALVGSIDIPGGLLRQRRAPLGEMPPVSLNKTAEKGLSFKRIDAPNEQHKSASSAHRIKEFIDHVIEKDPYEINFLFLLNTASNISASFNAKMEEAFKRIPFIVSFSTFLDESCKFADIILPDTTYFEKWQEIHISPLSKVPVVGVGQPVVPPLYQSRPFEDVFLTLARIMGPPLDQNFPWKSFKELIFYRLEGLYHAKRGGIFDSFPEETQMRILEERGWWIPKHDTLDDFMKDLTEKGGWQDPVYHFNERSYIYQTASQKYEFATPDKMESYIDYPDVFGNEEKYPFLLHFYDLPFASEDNGANQPWYQENLGFRFNLKWKIWVEINPETARKLNIHDKELVWIESSYGKIQAVAKIFPGIMPDVLGIPVGKVKDFPVRRNGEKQNMPHELLGETFVEQNGVYSRQLLRAKIYKLNKGE